LQAMEKNGGFYVYRGAPGGRRPGAVRLSRLSSRRFRAGLLAGLMLVLLAGCGVRQLTSGEITPPQVKFQGIAVGVPDSQGWPLGVSLLLTNPNDRSLELKGYNYELWLEGKSVARGTGETPVVLPPRGQTVARVPILVQLPAVMSLLPQLLQPEPGPVAYRVAGSFRLKSVLGGLVPLPFSFQGRLTPRQGMEMLRPYLH
jgi:LEA14-like dessication related protein